MKPASRTAQAGVTLIELLVGLAIGLMTVAVALGALLVSRGVSGTVSEASQLQQQGTYALRVIGQQLRQAGSTRLNLGIAVPAGQAFAATDAVAFERSFDRSTGMLGANTSHPLRVGYQNYTERTTADAKNDQSLLRDCLGRQPSATVIQSDFRLVRESGAVSGELRCVGADGGTNEQTLIGNVADFQIRYLVQGMGADGAATVRRTDAAGVGSDWGSVVGVHVCLELAGDERIDTAGATYRPCGWVSGQAETAMGDRMRLVFRNMFQLRTQGAPR